MKRRKENLLTTAIVLLAATVLNGVEVTKRKHRGSELVLFTPTMLRARRRILKRRAEQG